MSSSGATNLQPGVESSTILREEKGKNNDFYKEDVDIRSVKRRVSISQDSPMSVKVQQIEALVTASMLDDHLSGDDDSEDSEDSVLGDSMPTMIFNFGNKSTSSSSAGADSDSDDQSSTLAEETEATATSTTLNASYNTALGTVLASDIVRHTSAYLRMGTSLTIS